MKQTEEHLSILGYKKGVYLMEYVLTILIILLIFKEEIKGIFVRNKPIEKTTELEKSKIQARKEEFPYNFLRRI